MYLRSFLSTLTFWCSQPMVLITTYTLTTHQFTFTVQTFLSKSKLKHPIAYLTSLLGYLISISKHTRPKLEPDPPPSTFDPFHLFSPWSCKSVSHFMSFLWSATAPHFAQRKDILHSLSHQLSFYSPTHSFCSGLSGLFTLSQTCHDYSSFQPLC